LSTLVLEGSDAAARGPGVALRFADLILLALALPLFLLAGLPMLGYAVAAAAWVAQHALLALAHRSATAALRRDDRRRALAMMGASTLGRVWLVTLAILLVGVLGEREDGLAAAVLSLGLVTVHLGSMAFARLLYPAETR
jgi:L-asparagine transporter-like permease